MRLLVQLLCLAYLLHERSAKIRFTLADAEVNLADAPSLLCPLLPQVFDVAAVRAALEQRLKSLELELHQARGSLICLVV